jgi:hypothetical protein
MNINVPQFLIINANFMRTSEGYLWELSVHQASQSCHKASIYKVSVLIYHEQVDLETPYKSSLDYTKTLSVDCAARLENLIDESGNVDSHFLESDIHAGIFAPMQQR